MKKCSVWLLTLLAIVSLCVPAHAAERAREEACTITVNQRPLDLDGLPFAPYREGDTVMVPLRRIGEALGYRVEWHSETKTASIEDHIQKAVLADGTAAVVFEGKLKVIDLSREIENPVPTVIHSGHTYVPLEFFQEFFNDISIKDGVIAIAPGMSELCGT